jgi:hypothetical protein
VRSRKPKCFFGLKGSRGSRKGGQESAVAASSGRLESVSDFVWLLVEKKGKSLQLARNQGAVWEFVWPSDWRRESHKEAEHVRTPFQTGS